MRMQFLPMFGRNRRHQEFPVSLRPQYGGWNYSNHLKSKPGCKFSQRIAHLFVYAGVSNYSCPLRCLLTACFELRFYERDEHRFGFQKIDHRWNHQLERDERCVDGGYLNRLGHEFGRQVPDISSFKRDHTGVVPQFERKLAISNINCIDPACSE